MPTIDDKVVAMSFESDKFERGVRDTISILDKLKAALHFPDAGKGFDSISKAAGRVNLGQIGTSLDTIKEKLRTFHLVAVGVLSNIATQAVRTAARFAKSFTIQPLIQGFQEYSTNLNSIQTILANTKASGADLQDVNAALDELNEYSDKTIYNFSQMARNIGTFTAAGVALKPATSAIKGIANLAALSGSNSEQASTAMYQLSQAISAGRVSLQDWNSVVNAGMGGTVFQRALAQTAEAMGKLKDGTVKLTGPMKNVSINGESFRQSIQAGPGKVSWLTSDVLTKTLSQFTGDLTDAELAAQGFNAAQIKSIQETAKTAQHAATEVKTITQVFDVAKETAGSGWAKTFQLIFGDFEEAKTTFTNLSNAINGFINTNADARNKVLGDWKKLGGRTVLIDSIKTAFHNLGLVIAPIKKAFRDIFPATTGRDLYNLTLRFKDFADALKPSPQTIENLRRTFRGLFAILDIGKQVIGGIFSVFGKLFGVVGSGSGSFLGFTANIGDFLVRVDEALKKGDLLTTFFTSLGGIIAFPVKLLKAFADILSNLFSGFSPGGFSDEMDRATQALSPFQQILEVVSRAWERFLSLFDNADNIIGPVINGIAEAFQGLGPGIANAISNTNFEAILQVIRTGLFAALVLMFKNFFGKGSLVNQLSGLGGGIFKNLGGALNGVTGSLKAMQQSLKAKALRDIAIAIALLALSVVAMSFVDPKKLNSAMGALTIMMGELLGAMKILTVITATTGFIKLPVVTASLIGLAIAIDLLTLAVLALSRLSWEDLKKGLVGVGAMLGGLTAVAGPLGKNSAGMIRAGIGISAIAVGLNIMAFAVRRFGEMDLPTLAKGLGGVAVALGVVAVAVKSMPLGMAIQGAGLIAIAIGLDILANAVSKLGNLNWKVLGKGLAAVGIALVVIGRAMNLMPITLPITAAGLLLVSISLGKIVKAVATMGRMSIKQLSKGLLSLGLSLEILSGGLIAMSEAIGGAVALGIAAAGISLLVPALVVLGNQSWGEIIKGLIGLAGAFAVLGVAGLVLAPIAPALLALGAAMILIGGGLALAGAGIALVGIGLAAIAVSGPAAIAILLKALTDFVAAIPELAKNFVLGLLEIVRALAATAPQFVDALIKIIGSLLEAIVRLTPKFVVAFQALLDAALKVFYANKDKIIQAGLDLLISLLQGISNNIERILTVAGDVVVNFLRGLANQARKIVNAGVKFITSLINGIAQGSLDLIEAAAKALLKFLVGLEKAIDKYEWRIIVAGINIGKALVRGVVKGLLEGSGLSKLKKAVDYISDKIPDWMKKGLLIHSPSLAMESIGKDIIGGLTKGITDDGDKPVYAVKDVTDKMTKTVKAAAKESFEVLKGIGADAVRDFGRGLRGAPSDIRNAFHELNKALFDSAQEARTTIKEEQARLKELMKHPIQQAANIKAAQKAIAANQKILAESVAGSRLLTGALKDEEHQLVRLSRTYNITTQRLDAALQTLSDAKRARDDAFKSFKEQYSSLPDIVSVDAEGRAADQVQTYKDALETQIKAIAAFRKTLNQLRKLGLDDTTYKKLLEMGTAGQAFADELAAGGKASVAEVNKLDKRLDAVSAGLATDASKSLYQAGVDAAQGLVDGLKSVKSELSRAMTGLVVTIVKAVKNQLKIKSPSQVFMEIGQSVSQGMAKGIIESSRAVTDAVYMVSDDAMGAMRNSLTKISDVVLNEIDSNPTITPILDLTQVQAQAKSLDSMFNVATIGAKTSSTQASRISSSHTTVSLDDPVTAPGGNAIKFEQNNYSPKALDPIEIYRQTRTQIAQLRAAVVPIRGV